MVEILSPENGWLVSQSELRQHFLVDVTAHGDHCGNALLPAHGADALFQIFVAGVAISDENERDLSISTSQPAGPTHQDVVDGVYDGSAHIGGRIHVSQICQAIGDDRTIAWEFESHILVISITILQQSHTGVSFVSVSTSHGQALSHSVHKLFDTAEVLQTHSFRAIQQEHQINRPLDTTGHCRLCKRHNIDHRSTIRTELTQSNNLK